MTLRDTRSAVRQSSREKVRRTIRYVTLIICALIVIGASTGLAIIRPWTHKSIHPTQSVRYLGVYQPDAPDTYSSVDKFARAIGRQPNLVSYYSPWLEPFQARFARLAASHGAETIVQIDPKMISLASIAAGDHHNLYLRSYATAVRAFGSQGGPIFWTRNERRLVLLGLQTHFSAGLCSCLETRRHRVPRERGHERRLAMDGQCPQQEHPNPSSRFMVAWEFLRGLGRYRWLLLPVVRDLLPSVRTYHCGRAGVYTRSNLHCGDRGGLPQQTSLRRSTTCSPAFARTG